MTMIVYVLRNNENKDNDIIEISTKIKKNIQYILNSNYTTLP